MPDLLWDDVRDFFDPYLTGSLPDLRVEGASVAGWQAVFDLVRSSGWRWEYSEGNAVLPLPEAAEALSRPVGAEISQLKVWPVPGVLVIFRLWVADTIDFDVDLRELQGQERLDILCRILAAIGRKLGKPVLMAPEGGHDPVLGFDVGADRVVLLADPRLG